MKKFIKDYSISQILDKIANPLIIVLGILLSFYLDNMVERNNKIEYKNFVIKNLKMILIEDLSNIEKIKSLQNDCYIACETLINDIKDGNIDLSEKEIATNYLLISQNGWTSFFPQNSTYDELISTGSMEIISSVNFRKSLTNTYTHLYERNLQISRTIDDFFLMSNSKFGPHFVIEYGTKQDEGYIYDDLVPISYKIDKDFYLSNTAISDLLQAKKLIGNYLNLLEEYENSYLKLQLHAEEEIN